MAKQFPVENCPICNTGTLVPYCDGKHEFMHKGKLRVLNTLHYATCDHCGTEGMSEEQADENIRLIAEFEESLKDYISPKNIRRIRDKYRISQAEAGEIFQCGSSYFSKWERGEIAPTGPAAVLLRSSLKDEEIMQRIATDAGVTVTIPPKKKATEQIKKQDLLVTHSDAWLKLIEEVWQGDTAVIRPSVTPHVNVTEHQGSFGSINMSELFIDVQGESWTDQATFSTENQTPTKVIQFPSKRKAAC